EQRLPPGWIIHVPLDGLIEAFFKTAERLPIQFALRKCRVDGVAAVMTKPNRHEINETVWFAKRIQNNSDKVQIHHLTVAAQIINRSRFAFEKRSDNAGAMIVHVDPVAHVHAIAINRERLLPEQLNDHERN